MTLYKHVMNEGPIKARTDDVRLAKGKYLTIIDGDDSLIHKNVLYNALKIAEMGKLDIIEFKSASYRNRTFLEIVNDHKLINITGIVYQP